MTEAEWLSCNDPTPMLYFLSGKRSDRKTRLFACACLRQFWHRLDEQGIERKAIEIAEWFADGLMNKRDMLRINAKLWEICYRVEFPFALVAWELTAHSSVELGCRRTSEIAGMLTAKMPDGAQSRAVQYKQVQILMEIFGNPFRHSPSLHPANLEWHEARIIKLAQAIYDDRAFDRLPILADALEDAGCTDTTILDHCRNGGVHVRGCWALDLLLGKE